MYHDLFNVMTDAINILQQAQIDIEEKYLDSTETDNIERMKFKVVEKQENKKVGSAHSRFASQI